MDSVPDSLTLPSLESAFGEEDDEDDINTVSGVGSGANEQAAKQHDSKPPQRTDRKHRTINKHKTNTHTTRHNDTAQTEGNIGPESRHEDSHKTDNHTHSRNVRIEAQVRSDKKVYVTVIFTADFSDFIDASLSSDRCYGLSDRVVMFCESRYDSEATNQSSILPSDHSSEGPGKSRHLLQKYRQ